jgi:hypothetical protein
MSDRSPFPAVAEAVRVGVTVVVLGTCLYVILSPNYFLEKAGAFALVGAVVMHWLPRNSGRTKGHNGT